jgi:hypothetical protein
MVASSKYPYQAMRKSSAFDHAKPIEEHSENSGIAPMPAKKSVVFPSNREILRQMQYRWPL